MGELLGIIAGIGFGVFQTTSSMGLRHVGVYEATLLQVLVAGVALPAVALLSGDVARLNGENAESLAWFAAGGFLNWGAGIALLGTSQRRLGAVRTGPLLATTPLFGTALAAVSWARPLPSSRWRGCSSCSPASSWERPCSVAAGQSDARHRGTSTCGLVDGNDVAACLEVLGDAVAAGRSGDGPRFVQADTYRRHGHYSGDAGTYRPAEEVERWESLDPIARLGAGLAREGIAGGELDRIRSEAVCEVERAVEFARRSPEPSPDDLLRDVLSGDPHRG